MQTLQSRVSPSKVQVSQGPTGTSFLLHHPHVPKVRHDSRHHTCMSPRMFVGCLNGNRKRWVPAKKSSFRTEEEEEGFHRQLQHIMYMPKSGDQFRVQVQHREITGTYYHPSSGLTLNKHEVIDREGVTRRRSSERRSGRSTTIIIIPIIISPAKERQGLSGIMLIVI